MKVKISDMAFYIGVIFLLTFMLFIFGPSEIFFSNVTEFEFVYGEFISFFVIVALGSAILGGIVLCLLPDKFRNSIITVLFAMSIAGYMQIMFFNKNLDLLGVNPEGHSIDTTKAVINAILWIGILVISFILMIRKKELWRKIVGYASAFLLSIQMVALFSLIITASDNAYKYSEIEWKLDGENQFTVSSEENIIVFVLDYYANEYLDKAKAIYPGITDFLHDFTYYSNTDCTYFGTYPSLNHMLTGQTFEPTIATDDWCKKVWEADGTEAFYDMMHENGYVTNLYTDDLNILCANNSPELLNEKISNIESRADSVVIRHKLLFKTLMKMSCYRMAPEAMKNLFYVDANEYSGIVTYEQNNVIHYNYDFNSKLLTQGLQLDENNKYYQVQHLMGTHEYTTAGDGSFKENAVMEETAIGVMHIMNNYLEELKRVGAYDNSTIILTADHGRMRESQIIFFIKEKGEHHDKLQITDAPISLKEFLPTIVKSAGGDSTEFGKTIYDFKDGETRERTFMTRMIDYDYDMVPNYAVNKEAAYNVYYEITYEGKSADLIEHFDKGPDKIYQMKDGYY